MLKLLIDSGSNVNNEEKVDSRGSSKANSKHSSRLKSRLAVPTNEKNVRNSFSISKDPKYNKLRYGTPKHRQTRLEGKI